MSSQVQTTLLGADPSAGRTSRASTVLYQQALARFRTDRLAVGSFFVFLLVLGFVLGAPLVSQATGFTYYENHLNRRCANQARTDTCSAAMRTGAIC